MARFLLRRLVSGAGVVLFTAVFAYGSWRVLRSDQYAGEGLLGGTWGDVHAALRLDFGYDSWKERLLPDVWMMAGTLALGFGAGVRAGTYCALHRGTLRARALEALAMALLCVWPLVLGYAIIYFWKPSLNLVRIYAEPWDDPWAWARSLAIPWVVASLPLFGACLRLTRSGVVDALDEDFVRTAAAKGLTHRDVVRRHGRAAAMPSVLAYMSAGAAVVVLNVTLIESVFSVPGLLADLRRGLGASNVERFKGVIDPALVQQISLWTAVLITATSAVFDLALARRDPRIGDRGAPG